MIEFRFDIRRTGQRFMAFDMEWPMCRLSELLEF